MARARWAKSKKQISHARLLFVDESGAKTNMTRRYARAARGVRAYDRVPCGRWETTTMIAAVGRNGPQAPWVIEGPIDGHSFATWATHVLAPTLIPGDIVVLDNLSAHRNSEAASAIEAKGATVWFLPPYSPDLNPIEKMWSKIKALLRKAKARDPETLFTAIGSAFAAVSKSDIQNWFASCGYSFI
jgi:transposase